MSIAFQDYCEEYLDLDIALMSEEQLKNARSGYADLVSDSKTPTKNSKHSKALAKAKESRKLAKFYGGKALTGSAKQKKWAEDIRQTVLESSALSDEQKTKLVKLAGMPNTAKFWINNRDKSAEKFDADTIVAEYQKLVALHDKHYDTLARQSTVAEKEAARKEIYGALSTLTVAMTIEFPNCDFYDFSGNLKKRSCI
tara:strand:- start:361 stop:954 length:594 start_codon:yes stop_codon:yes gene_type:complete